MECFVRDWSLSDCQTVRLSDCEVVRWSDGQIVKLSDGQIVRWSDGQTVRWPDCQMVVRGGSWPPDHSEHGRVKKGGVVRVRVRGSG